MASTFYADGSAEEFLAAKGFDDKWVVKEEPARSVWQDVGGAKKKKMSGAEKRARAARISEQALKNGDALRVDVDGSQLNKLLEKQARKEGMGERGQAPRPPKAKKAVVDGGAPPAAQQTEELAPIATSVPLKSAHLRAQLASIVARHEQPYAQVIALGELMHESFSPLRIDLCWHAHTGTSASPQSWLSGLASLLPQDTVSVIVEWLDAMPHQTLTELFEFLVEHAMPGGGKLGRGGEQPSFGLKALLQIALSRVQGARGGASWHDGGAHLGRFVSVTERRVSTAAAPSVMWMAVQLAQQDALAALRCYFLYLQPVLEKERCPRLALQCASVLAHLLGKQSSSSVSASCSPVPISGAALLRLVKLCFPMTDTAASEQVFSKNTEAVAALRALMRDIVARASVVGLNKDSCARTQLPILLPAVVQKEEFSDEARAEVTRIILCVISSDPSSLKVLAGNFEAHLAAITHVIDALGRVRGSGGVVSMKQLKTGLVDLRQAAERAVVPLQLETTGKGGESAAQIQMQAKKAQKRQARMQEYRHLMLAVDRKLAGRGGGWIGALLKMAMWCLVLAFGAVLVLTHVAVHDDVCFAHLGHPHVSLCLRGGVGVCWCVRQGTVACQSLCART